MFELWKVHMYEMCIKRLKLKQDKEKETANLLNLVIYYNDIYISIKQIFNIQTSHIYSRYTSVNQILVYWEICVQSNLGQEAQKVVASLGWLLSTVDPVTWGLTANLFSLKGKWNNV